MIRVLVGGLILAGFPYAGLGALLYFQQRSFIYPVPTGAAPVPSGFEQIEYTTSDDLRLSAGFRAGDPDKPASIFFHRNATTWPMAAQSMQPLAEQGYSVLAAEYRGYAGNDEETSESGLYRDARAALAWLQARPETHDGMFLIGNSLGSGVAVQLASEAKFEGLALVSPYSSMTELVAEKVPWLPTGLLLQDRYESRSKLADIDAPILILHGDRDRVIPVIHAQRLADLRSDIVLRQYPKYGHELVWLPEAQVALADWLGELEAKRPAILLE